MTSDSSNEPISRRSKHGKALRDLNESVGELVLFFSSIETVLFATLGSLWNVPLPIAKALYSDLRVEASINTARRLVSARQQLWGKNPFETQIERWTDYAFTQLAIINGVRNHIVHHGYGGTQDFQNPVVTNRLRAREEGHVKEISVSAIEIEAMLSDLAGVVAILSVIGTALLNPTAASDGFKRLEHAPPWKYKSPLQGGKKATGGASHEKKEHSGS